MTVSLKTQDRRLLSGSSHTAGFHSELQLHTYNHFKFYLLVSKLYNQLKQNKKDFCKLQHNINAINSKNIKLVKVKWKAKSLSRVQLFATPWTMYSPWNLPGQNTGVGSLSLLSRGSSQPRDQTQVSCIAGGFFTSWATREAIFQH